MSGKGIYPGTFDPVTNGHMDIIKRSLRVVDQLVVAVAGSPGKGPMFSLDERVALVEAELATLPADLAARVEVKPFDTLLMHFALEQGAGVIMRGLRAVSRY